MSGNSIELDVTYAQGSQIVQAVRVGFGDGHAISIAIEKGTTRLEMTGREISLALDATGPACEFERAINLLRLYMRKTARDPENRHCS